MSNLKMKSKPGKKKRDPGKRIARADSSSDSEEGVALLADRRPAELDALLHFSAPSPFLAGRREQIRPMLESLYTDLGYSIEAATAAKTSLYAIRESQLKTLKRDLGAIVAGGEASAEAFQHLLTTDNPVGRALLSDEARLAQIINELPTTEATHAAIEAVEQHLITQADAAIARGKAPTMSLKIATHEAFFRKKTEILETVVEQIVADSKDPKLAGLKGLKKEDYWKILIDGQVHKYNNKHFYDRSKGYMASMMKGLELIASEIDSSLSTAFVQKLHRAVTEFVTNETKLDNGIPLTSSVFQETGIKRTPNSWGVTKQYSDAGMNELAALRKELDDLVPGGYFSEDAMRFADLEPDRVVQWKAGKSPVDLAGTVTRLMDHVIDKADREIKAAGADQDAIIGAIVDCCRGLGIIHPFKDANGRLIMFLVLNKLLLENKMRPTILEDQGLMVGKSKTELIKLIKDGQAAVEKMATS